MNELVKHFDNIVVIDSNFILLPLQHKIDYFSEIRFILEGSIKFVVSKYVLTELEFKHNSKNVSNKFQRYYRTGLQYLEQSKKRYTIEVSELKINSNEPVDNFLVRLCSQYRLTLSKVFLATNDQELKRMARNSDVGVLYMRQNKYIAVDHA